jgi:hypothetical protein
MLAGRLPFHDRNHERLFEKIIKDVVEFVSRPR